MTAQPDQRFAMGKYLQSRWMKLPVVLAVFFGILVPACSSAASTPAEPTPNIDATVEAKLAQERAVEATVEAKGSDITVHRGSRIP